MAFKTFAPGVLTSSDVNTYLMRQAVISCTSSTRPASPQEGMTIYETDTNLYQVYSGTAWEVLASYGAWTSFTPVLTNWTLGNATHDCAYARFGRMIVARYHITWGSTSAFSSGLEIGHPVTAADAYTPSRLAIGSGYMRDDSLAAPYAAVALQFGTTRFEVASMDVPGGGATVFPVRIVGTTPTLPFTWASGDSISVTITYEAAA